MIMPMQKKHLAVVIGVAVLALVAYAAVMSRKPKAPTVNAPVTAQVPATNAPQAAEPDGSKEEPKDDGLDDALHELDLLD